MVNISNYFNKRDEFVDAHKLAGSDSLREVLRRAVFNTDLALATFLVYVTTLNESLDRLTKLKEEFAKQDSDAAGAIEQIKEMKQPTADSVVSEEKLKELAGMDEALKEPYEQYQALMDQSNQLMSEILPVLEKSHQNAAILQDAVIRIDLFCIELTKGDLTSSLFEKVFKSRTDKFVKDALVDILGYLVGISPVGAFTDAILTIKGIYRARVDEINAADDYIRYLEVYSLTAQQWSAATQVIIDTILRLPKDEPMQLADSAETIKQRKEALSVNWNLETPILTR
jgi:hypothetical protein